MHGNRSCNWQWNWSRNRCLFNFRVASLLHKAKRKWATVVSCRPHPAPLMLPFTSLLQIFTWYVDTCACACVCASGKFYTIFFLPYVNQMSGRCCTFVLWGQLSKAFDKIFQLCSAIAGSSSISPYSQPEELCYSHPIAHSWVPSSFSFWLNLT